MWNEMQNCPRSMIHDRDKVKVISKGKRKRKKIQPELGDNCNTNHQGFCNNFSCSRSLFGAGTECLWAVLLLIAGTNRGLKRLMSWWIILANFMSPCAEQLVNRRVINIITGPTTLLMMMGMMKSLGLSLSCMIAGYTTSLTLCLPYYKAISDGAIMAAFQMPLQQVRNCSNAQTRQSWEKVQHLWSGPMPLRLYAGWWGEFLAANLLCFAKVVPLLSFPPLTPSKCYFWWFHSLFIFFTS